MTSLTHGLDAVRARIADAAAAAGRDASSITLVAVTKGFAWQEVRPVVEAGGLIDLGENRVQELRAKQQLAADEHLRWHLIGTLQRNKVKDVVGRVVLIHSIDTPELAATIGARAHAAGSTQDVLVEVNTSGEATKHGVAPGEAERLADLVARTDGLRLRGLMTIAAPGDGDAARRSFARLRALRDSIAAHDPQVTELSMGMSGDLEQAIAEGATIVRVGTAIFGERPGDHHDPDPRGPGPGGSRASTSKDDELPAGR